MKRNYCVLTENEFFQKINGVEKSTLETAYASFVNQVIELCHENSDPQHSIIALIYSEIELQFHRLHGNEKEETAIYVSKALVLVKKMQSYLTKIIQMPIQSLTQVSKNKDEVASPVLQWTGNILDLVELIYGLYEMGCIDKGKTPLNIIAPKLYFFFGVKTQECYRYYSAIKQRKNASRTYFLDEMQEKLNEKMRRDDEQERIRK